MLILPRTDLSPPQISVVVAVTVLSTLSVLTVSCRLFTRLQISRNAGVDDVLLAIALAFLLIFNIYVCSELSDNSKSLEDDLSQATLSGLLKSQLASVVIYCIATAATRISVLLQYLRFLTDFTSKWACWIMMVMSILYAGGTIFATAFRCFMDHDHLAKIPFETQCQGETKLWFASGISNIVVDLVILSIPVPAILQLQITLRQKLAVLGVFTVGGLVCLITIFRLKALVELTASGNATEAKSAQATIWTHAELSSSIICASLPGMKPFFQSRCGGQRKPPAPNEVIELKRVNSEVVAVPKKPADIEKGLKVEVVQISLPSPTFSIRRETENIHNVS